MVFNPRRATLFISILAVCLGGCVASLDKKVLTVEIGPPVYYSSDNGDQFVARYGSLSDGSLHFVKVKMPDGQEYTLPQVVSGSGVRYTDDRELAWWTHQGTVRVDVRDADGKWKTKYSELKEEIASSPNCDGEAAALSAAEAWLSLVDEGKYEKSWFEAAQYFKSVVSEDQWEQAIRAARKPLGKNLSREFISKSCHTSLPGAPDGEYVVIRFKASFENKKSAIETITPMMDKDGKWRVSGYYIK